MFIGTVYSVYTSFPRKRESSGRGLNTRDSTQSFQTTSHKITPSLTEQRRGIFRLSLCSVLPAASL